MQCKGLYGNIYYWLMEVLFRSFLVAVVRKVNIV